MGQWSGPPKVQGSTARTSADGDKTVLFTQYRDILEDWIESDVQWLSRLKIMGRLLRLSFVNQLERIGKEIASNIMTSCLISHLFSSSNALTTGRQSTLRFHSTMKVHKRSKIRILFIDRGSSDYSEGVNLDSHIALGHGIQLPRFFR